MKISVSFLSSKFNTKETINKIDNSQADYIHVDFMDGKFVDNKNFTPTQINNLLKDVNKPLDVHLMVANPLKYLDTFAYLKTEYLTFHYEAVKDPKTIIDAIKQLGIKVGMSIKPHTSIGEIKPYLEDLDMVLVMSVEPGQGGQEFMTFVLTKVEDLKRLKKQYNYIISIDGGIDEYTSSLALDAGVDMLVSGSFICQHDDFDNQIDLLKQKS